MRYVYVYVIINEKAINFKKQGHMGGSREETKEENHSFIL